MSFLIYVLCNCMIKSIDFFFNNINIIDLYKIMKKRYFDKINVVKIDF